MLEKTVQDVCKTHVQASQLIVLRQLMKSHTGEEHFIIEISVLLYIKRRKIDKDKYHLDTISQMNNLVRKNC